MAAIDTGNMKDDETPSVKKQKGSNGYPKGVSETGRKTIRFQARVGYKPSPDGKTVQRSAGHPRGGGAAGCCLRGKARRRH